MRGWARGRSRSSQVTSARFQQGRPIVGLEGFASINDAERLAGAELRIPEEEQAPLPAGTLLPSPVDWLRGRHCGRRVARQGRRGAGWWRRDAAGRARAPAEVLIPLAQEICASTSGQADCRDATGRDCSKSTASGGRFGVRNVKIDIVTIFPEMVEAGLAAGVVGRARQSGLLDMRRAQPSRLHDRPASRRRRCAVWRRTRDGAEAGAAVCRGGSDRGRSRAAGMRCC